MRTHYSGLVTQDSIVIAGPTASGKTELALLLARQISGEIISADSRQIYRHLDAGTAKPERDPGGLAAGVPYHLIDIADPSEAFDAGKFIEGARSLMREISSRGRTPVIVGGTGFYLKALLRGLSPMPKGDEKIRMALEERAQKEGGDALRRRLEEVDPIASKKIPANNIQRMIRALEVHAITGRPISSFWDMDKAESSRNNDAAILSIEWPRDELKSRIVERAKNMWPEILSEVRRLVPSRYTGQEPGFQSLGYREALECAQRNLSEAEGLARLTKLTLAYAKRQRTWLRHQITPDAVIVGGPANDMLKQVLGTPHLILNHLNRRELSEVSP